MKSTLLKSTLGIKFLLALFISGSMMQAIGQERICLSYEYELAQREKYPELGTIRDFENRFATIVNQVKTNRMSEEGVFTIPIIVHIIHDGEEIGEGDNLSAALVQAQINQLNYDFRKIEGTSGYNDDPVGADTFIEFAPALVDEEGNLLAEPGINRINRNDMGWTAPPYDGIGSTYIDDVIKADSYWNPDLYFNFWVMDLSGGLLGYAQFPSSSGLDGLNTNGGLAETDGVVVLASSVGGDDLPNPDGGSFDLGRTATHEVGHWLGLRHIWGDGGCGVDDFCEDTPESDASNGGCPTGHESCGTVDMIENYMDYTDDACMNIFTLDQKARMDAVLAVSPRRASLANSTVHLAPFPNLIISEVVDGSEDGDVPKYVEIHNAGEETYDLSTLSIRIFADGASEYTASVDIPLETMLAGGESYVISTASFDVGWGFDFTTETPDQINLMIDVDGGDAVQLYDNDTGLAIDVFGVIGESGAGSDWDYTDGIAERKSYVLRPNNGNFSVENWSFDEYSASSASPGSHTAETPSFDPAIAGLLGIEDGETYFACEGSIELFPVISIANLGTDPIGSVDLTVYYNGEPSIVTAMFEPSIVPGGTSDFPLSSLSISEDGEFSLEVMVSDESDGNPTNNNDVSIGFAVNIFEDASTLTVETQADDFPEEISWTISDIEGNVIYEKSSFEAFSLDSEDVCLEDGDYIFALSDAYGDGILDGYSSLYVGEELIVTIPGDHPDFDATPFGADPETIEVAFSIPFISSNDVGVEITSPEGGTLEFCSSLISLLATFTNEGTTVINSIEISYGIAGNLSTEYYDDLFFTPGEEMAVDLGLIELSDGSNSVEVNVVAINEDEDDNSENNGSAEVMFTEVEGNSIFINLFTDSFPEETSWELTDSEGFTIEENGELSGNADIISVLCLEDGTYTFTLFDEFEDGIENEIAVSISDGEEQQVAILGGNFSDETSVTFTLPYVPFTDMSVTIIDPADESTVTSCSNIVPVEVEIENTGSAAITSFSYSFGGEQFDVDEDFLLNPGETVTGLVGEYELVEGANSLSVAIVAVNGAPDDDSSNDIATAEVTYVVDETTSAVQVDLHLDGFSSETSWDIVDNAGNIVASGGDYTEEDVTITEVACLEDGCYTFNLYDSWGDGGPGVDVIVDGNIEFAVEPGDWGNQAFGTFCVGDVLRPVSDFEAEAASPFSIDLSWSYDFEEDGFQVLRSNTGNDGSYAFLSEVESTETSFTDDNGLEASTTYYYAIVAKRGDELSSAVFASASTPANVGVTALYEGFEGETFPPADWTNVDADEDGNLWFIYSNIDVGSEVAYAGDNSAGSASYVNGVGALNPDNYLITPQVSISSDYVLTYAIGAQDPSFPAEKYSVLVSTTGTDIEDFTDEIHSETLSDGDWHLNEFPLSSYDGQDIYIAFRHFDVTDQFYLKLDEVFVGTISDEVGGGVLPPANLTATAVSPYQIDLEWEHDDADAFEIHRSLSDAIGAFEIVEIVAGTELSYSDFGLVPNTTYYYEVRAVKGEDTSVGATASATTDQEDLGDFKLDESFEGETFPPADWVSLDEDGDTFNWYQGISPSHEAQDGDKSAVSASYENDTPAALNPDNYLITPAVEIVDGDFLVYYVAAQDPSFPAEKYEVLVSTTSIDVEDFTDQVFTEVLSTDVWAERQVDLSSYAGETIHIAFRHFDVSDQFEMKIDNVKIGDPSAGETPPVAPSGLAATAVSSSSIALTWTDNADNEDGFELQRADAAEGPWADVSTSIAADATSYSDTGLDEETTYFYRLRASNATGLTVWSNVASATTDELVLGTDYLGDIRVQMYPNPVESSLTISLGQSADVQVEVVDFAGKVHSVKINKNSQNIQVDMSQLATGLYFVTLKYGQDELNWRILKK